MSTANHVRKVEAACFEETVKRVLRVVDRHCAGLSYDDPRLWELTMVKKKIRRLKPRGPKP